jgi:hypothetical protein
MHAFEIIRIANIDKYVNHSVDENASCYSASLKLENDAMTLTEFILFYLV